MKIDKVVEKYKNRAKIGKETFMLELKGGTLDSVKSKEAKKYAKGALKTVFDSSRTAYAVADRYNEIYFADEKVELVVVKK